MESMTPRSCLGFTSMRRTVMHSFLALRLSRSRIIRRTGTSALPTLSSPPRSLAAARFGRGVQNCFNGAHSGRALHRFSSCNSPLFSFRLPRQYYPNFLPDGSLSPFLLSRICVPRSDRALR